MSLYSWPERARVNRRLPKDTLIQNAKISRIRLTPKIRASLTAEIERITITHQLAPQSINLPARKGVEDIMIIELRQKTECLSDGVLHWIDRTLPRATIFECRQPDGNTQMVMAHKRPSAADKSKWVIGAYHASEWQDGEKQNGERRSIPIATNLAELYTKLLRSLLPYSAQLGETLDAHLARCEAISALEKICEQLKSKINKETQMNRRVALNDELKIGLAELAALRGI